MKPIILFLILISLQSTILAKESVLKISACGIVRYSFITNIANSFGEKNSIEIEIMKGSDNVVMQTLRNQKADIGAGCRISFRNNTQDESGIWPIQVAWGAMVFTVHRDNPINNITTINARKVLTGRITNWKELGGNDEPINLYLRKGKTTGAGFTARALLFHNHQKELHSKAIIKNNSTEIRQMVKVDKNAFAIDDIISARDNKNLKVLMVDGFSPTRENIMRDKYKLARPFYLYSYGPPRGIVRQFIRYALSKETQETISDLGLITLGEGRASAKLSHLLNSLNP